MSSRKPRTTTRSRANQKKHGNKEVLHQSGRKFALYNPLPSMPDEFDTKVKTFATLRSNAATSSIIQTIFTNTLLHGSDDIPSASAQNPSLAAIARNYTKYRVTGYRIDYTLSPRSASTIDCNMSVLHTPTVTAYSSASGWSPESATRDKSYFHFVPRPTSSPCIVSCGNGYSLLQLVGAQEYQQDDKYSGTLDTSGIPTSPTDLTYVYFYQGDASGAAFAASTASFITVMLTQVVRFYDKRY